MSGLLKTFQNLIELILTLYIGTHIIRSYMSTQHEAIAEALLSYNELNGEIDVLYEEPNPLEFMRYVMKNRPFVIRGGCAAWPAVRKWDCNYLRSALGTTPVKIAVTPNGLVPQRFVTVNCN